MSIDSLNLPQPFVPPGQHQLPPLPYPYNALEPVISARTMKIHHDLHHKAYVDNLNKTELQLVEARRTNNFENIRGLERNLAFNGSGHILHSIFWTVMAPGGSGQPYGQTEYQLIRYFGSIPAFFNQFTAAATDVEASGWAALAWVQDPLISPLRSCPKRKIWLQVCKSFPTLLGMAGHGW
jgi:Fe-Mn family superoxide dismutase